MKNLILSACIAAISLSACETNTPSTPVKEPAVRSEFSSKTAKKTLPVPSAIPDAGIPEATDMLAMEHSHRGQVDHVGRARELKNTGDFEGAMTEARRALFHDATDEEALGIVTRVAELTGNRKLMVEAFARSAELRPEDPMPLVKQARILVGMGKTKQAIEVAQNALLRDGEEPEAYHALGRAYLSRGDLTRAIELFKQTVERAPEHGYALNNLGFAYLRANMNDEAVTALTRAADILPAVAFVQNNLGVALERVGRMDEAKMAFAQATSLSPKYVKAQVNSKRLAKLETALEMDEVQPTEPDAEIETVIEE